jgi:hypothetical protein
MKEGLALAFQRIVFSLKSSVMGKIHFFLFLLLCSCNAVKHNENKVKLSLGEIKSEIFIVQNKLDNLDSLIKTGQVDSLSLWLRDSLGVQRIFLYNKLNEIENQISKSDISTKAFLKINKLAQDFQNLNKSITSILIMLETFPQDTSLNKKMIELIESARDASQKLSGVNSLVEDMNENTKLLVKKEDLLKETETLVQNLDTIKTKIENIPGYNIGSIQGNLQKLSEGQDNILSEINRKDNKDFTQSVAEGFVSSLFYDLVKAGVLKLEDLESIQLTDLIFKVLEVFFQEKGDKTDEEQMAETELLINEVNKKIQDGLTSNMGAIPSGLVITIDQKSGISNSLHLLETCILASILIVLTVYFLFFYFKVKKIINSKNFQIKRLKRIQLEIDLLNENIIHLSELWKKLSK